MKAAGISLRKAMKPLIYLSFAISIFAFLFSNYVMPVANLKFGSLLYDVRQQKLAFNISEGIYYYGLDGFVIRVGKKAKDNKTIYDVKIYNHSKNQGNLMVTTAKSGTMQLSANQKNLIFTLYDGYRFSEITNVSRYRVNRPFESVKFDKQVLNFDLSQFQLSRTNEELFKTHYSMLNIKQLNHSIDSLSNNLVKAEGRHLKSYIARYPYLKVIDTLTPQKSNYAEDQLNDTFAFPVINNFEISDKADIIEIALRGARAAKEGLIRASDNIETRQKIITKHEVVWHQKFKLSIACFLFFFIGAPLGAIIRKGGLGLPVVVSVLFFVMYHVISMMGEKAVKTGEMNIVFGLWLSTLIVLPLGLFLTYKATSDAQLMDTESWNKFFKKFNGKKKIEQ
jgi:lipopolysaccharide export system permease protein